MLKMNTNDVKDWSNLCAQTMIKREPNLDTGKWRYEDGLMLDGMYDVFRRTGNTKYFDYISHNLDRFIGEDGSIKGYNPEEEQLDHINNGKAILNAFEVTRKSKYKKAATMLFDQLKSQPRTENGVFWHKKIYPNQVWLDGVYMGDVFYARYQKMFDIDDFMEDAAEQVILAYQLTKDDNIGLCYHAFDGNKQMIWANKENGHSPHFWTRSIGWFVMAMVDILDYLPSSLPQRKQIISILQEQLNLLRLYSDTKTKLWYQVTDEGYQPLNYLESSGTLMILNAIAKSIRKGYLVKQEWAGFLTKSFQNALSHFISIDAQGYVNVHKIVYVSGLGGADNRDGSFEYYMSEPIVTNDHKGIGPFLMLANEMQDFN